MIYLLIWSQILFSIIGISLIIYSVWEYFFQPKSSFFTSKRIIEYLDESERRKYQKALAYTYCNNRNCNCNNSDIFHW